MPTMTEKLAEALRLISVNGCTNYRTPMSCFDDPDRTRGAQYSADSWCNACVAAEALASYDAMRAAEAQPDAEPLRMSAYYYEFQPTGVLPIDRILSAVACAGKAYHHTDCWKDDCRDYGHGDGSPIDWIQRRANQAAEAFQHAAPAPRSGDAVAVDGPDPYRVTVDKIGCPDCCGGRLWTVIGPDEACEGESWTDEDHAQEVAERMCRAYAAGKASATTPVAAQAEPIAWVPRRKTDSKPSPDGSIMRAGRMAWNLALTSKPSEPHPDEEYEYVPVYLHSAPIEVTDAMVERACVAAYVFEWRHLPEISRNYRRSRVRLALTAALSEVAK